MNAEELVSVPLWIDREIVNRGLPQLYAELASAVQANASGSIQAFESQRNALIDQLKEVDTNSLSDAQAEFVDRLNLLSHVGATGIDELENILYRNALDISTAAGTLNQISSEIQSAVDRSNQIKDALKGLVELHEQPVDEFLVRVVFDRDASIQDVVDLKKWANDWHDIGRGFAMAVDASPKELRVVGAQTGSIILTLATTLAIARLISSVLLKSLEVAEKVQGIRKAALEIESLKLSNEKLASDMREQAVKEKELGLHKIALDAKEGLPSLDGEQIAALERSIKKLLDFVEKGGEVDVILPLSMAAREIGQEEAEVSRLRADVMRIRELERDMRQLSYVPAPEDVAGKDERA